MTLDLLPQNATPLEKALSRAIDSYRTVEPNVTALRGLKLTNPPPSFLPYLVFEYGLGELTPYVPNLYELIREGIGWQRLRGTPAAVSLALAWVGYAGQIEEPPIRRQRWNLFMLALDQVRRSEPDLLRIEGVTQLSVPVRSVFWRGFHGYDVRALEYSRARWGGALWSSYSGVRLPPGQAKWSFGRLYQHDHVLLASELQALGVYLPEVAGNSQWGPFPWPATPWSDPAARIRSIAMLAEVIRQRAAAAAGWVVFWDADDAIIGYRRARALQPVEPALAGPYQVNGIGYAPRPSGATMLYLEAMTDFGDGAGRTARKAGFVLDGTPAAGHPPGALWLPPDGLQHDSPIIGVHDVDIPFGHTVRERIRALLRF